MNKIFNVWKFVIFVGIAKSGLWSSTIKGKDEIRYNLFSIHIIEKNDNKALSIIILPFMLTIGIV